MIKQIILLLLGFFIYVTQSNASTTIGAQVIRNQSGSGLTLISSGFPFPPGLVTESMITGGTIKVIVGGIEVASNVSALRGRHGDGTLRSALIQFTIPEMDQYDVLTASVIVDGGIRANPDPTYIRPTWDMVKDNNIILPTDSSYLSSTKITFQNLLPATQGTIAEEKQYTALADDRFNALVASPNEGTASYENVRAMLTLWVRTGDKKYFNHAVSYSTEWFRYNTPTSGSSCSNGPYINPDGRTDGTNGSCGAPAEQYAPRHFSYASLYLLTGYRDFWGYVANQVHLHESTYYISDQTTANTNVIPEGSWDTPRYNYSTRYGSMIAAYAIDATTPVPNPGGQASSMFTWQNNFQWVLNAIKNNEWDFKWIPFGDGSGTTPENGTTITQGGVSASLMGVYLNRYDPKRAPGKVMPSSGYLMVNNITGGDFSSGALSGISATAVGPQESDYRLGITGLRGNSPRSPNNTTLVGSISGTTLDVTSGSGIEIGSEIRGTGIPNFTFITNQTSGTAGGPGTYTVSDSCTTSSITITWKTVIPSFQMIFINNFLIDYYLNVYADSRIPTMVKKNLDVLLMQIRPMVSGDPYYGLGNSTWGYPQYGKPYTLENPVVTASGTAAPFELPEYPRFIAFVLKTIGSDTVNGATYETWYDRLVATANNSPASGLLTWQWKLFGQFYGFGADAPWIMAQLSLPAPSFRTPTNYAAIPGDTPDLGRPQQQSGKRYRNARIVMQE